MPATTPDTDITDIVDADIPRSWNYRVRAYSTDTGVPGLEPEDGYELIEVYYADDGRIVGWCDAGSPYADTPDGLRGVLTDMLAALDQPALTDDDLPGSDLDDLSDSDDDGTGG